ncbi:hypothetical protein UlMin_005713 [Ulmus minor]
MASQASQLHFLLFPLMAQGHLIPMVDIARLLAQCGAKITIITTPYNAARFEEVLACAMESRLQIQLFLLEFPPKEAGLPDIYQNLNMIPSSNLLPKFFSVLKINPSPLQKKAVKELIPKPNCIISYVRFPWTISIARSLQIPRISFHGFCCFSHFCMHNLNNNSKFLENISSETVSFVIPDLPGSYSYGVLVNSFEEMEPAYVKEYKKARNDKVWCVGPVSLCNKIHSDKIQRGNKSSVDEEQCLKLLDSWKPSSVVYVCFGSASHLIHSQLVELGLGLEASNKPFIWVISGWSLYEEEKWIVEERFEVRIKGRGLLIRGWAPQVPILSHPSIGGFLTHCGWNSTLEGISTGVPMVTWPLFADQILNEKLFVQVLHIAVSLGVKDPMNWGDGEKVKLVKRETIKSAVEKLMAEGEESKDRRERARKLREMENRAVEEGGSSHLNITLFIEQIKQLGSCEKTD